jgi:hypothetical protein
MEKIIKNLLVSFSGGETSAFMTQWINNNLKDKFDKILYIFANTGQENNETLEFVKKFSDYYNIEIIWVEALVNMDKGVGTKHKVVNYENCTKINDWKYRDDTPMEMVIKKYGIFNKAFPHCNRELKLAPINSYAKEFFNGEKYYSAIGIRNDEIDRINSKYKERKIIYPLIQKEYLPTKKPVINLFWKNMPFRLELKGYEGNCATCWKKSDNKLFKIASENNDKFEFFKKMEEVYSKNEFYFFRKNRSTIDMLNASINFNKIIKDDSKVYDYQLDLFDDSESCDINVEGCG